MSVIAIIQSNYIPWCGYFDIISSSDKFIFLDDVQFTKNDWRNRNLIKTVSGVQWLSVPCGKSISRTIDEVEVSNQRWANTHWRTLAQNYSNAPFFREFSQLFESFYNSWDKSMTLSATNQSLIKMIASDILDIECDYYTARELNIGGNRVDRLAKMVFELGGTEYLSGPSAKHYLNESVFSELGLTVKYAKYPKYGPYRQNYGDFIDSMSIVDGIFNLGRDVRKLFGCIS